MLRHQRSVGLETTGLTALGLALSMEGRGKKGSRRREGWPSILLWGCRMIGCCWLLASWKDDLAGSFVGGIWHQPSDLSFWAIWEASSILPSMWRPAWSASWEKIVLLQLPWFLCFSDSGPLLCLVLWSWHFRLLHRLNLQPPDGVGGGITNCFSSTVQVCSIRLSSSGVQGSQFLFKDAAFESHGSSLPCTPRPSSHLLPSFESLAAPSLLLSHPTIYLSMVGFLEKV